MATSERWTSTFGRFGRRSSPDPDRPAYIHTVRESATSNRRRTAERSPLTRLPRARFGWRAWLPDGLRARLTVTFGASRWAVVVFAVMIAAPSSGCSSTAWPRSRLPGRADRRQVAEDLANGDQRTVERALVLIDNETTARGLVVDAMGSLVGATEIEQREGLGRATTRSAWQRRWRDRPSASCCAFGPESEVLYVALPIVWQERVVGAIRLAYRPGHRGDDPPDQHRDRRRRVVTVAIAAALSAGLASAIGHDRALSHATRGLAAGELDQAGSRDTRRGRRAGRGVQPDSGAPPRVRGRALEFASDVSHELHALASAMQTAAQALQQGPTASRLRERLVAGLVGHTRRLGRLADDLLELARLEGGRLAIERAPVSLVGSRSRRSRNGRPRRPGATSRWSWSPTVRRSPTAITSGWSRRRATWSRTR